MRFVLLALIAVLASVDASRLCTASGDPHIRSMGDQYFNNYELGWHRFYELHGNRMLVWQHTTQNWRNQATIQKTKVTTRGGHHFTFDLAFNPCRVRLVRGNKALLTRWGSQGNGFQFKGAKGFSFRLEAGCSGDGVSAYTNIEVSDDSKEQGYGYCFNRGHQIPTFPKASTCKNGRRGLRFAKHSCRKIHCHRGLYVGCVDDVCKSGRAGDVEQHLKALNKLGRKCHPWKGLKKYSGHRKACFTTCKTISKNCFKAARCAKRLSGKSYAKICKKRRHDCRRACRKNWRRARRCVKHCFRRQRGCRKLARCAAPLANLKYICKARGNKCAEKCFTKIVKK